MDSKEFEVEITYSPPPYWNDLLFQAEKETNICQSIYWAKVLKRLEKAKPYFITVKAKDGEIYGLCLMVKRPSKKQGRLKNLLWYLECIDGPVILEDIYAKEVTEILLKNILKLANLLTLNVTISPSHNSKHVLNEELASIYRRLGFSAGKWGTYLVNLTKSEDESFSNLKHSARKCIKKCRKMDVKVEKIKNIEEFRDIYWDSYAKFEEEFKRPVRPFSPITWEENKDNLYHYFVAGDSDNRILAVLGMYVFNGVATEIASSMSRHAYEMKIPAQDLLHWEMMLEAKRLGCSIFDLAGVNPDPKDSKEAGIRCFKEKWGGKYTEYYIYKKEMLISKILELTRKIIRK